jgi:hypothetical protein
MLAAHLAHQLADLRVLGDLAGQGGEILVAGFQVVVGETGAGAGGQKFLGLFAQVAEALLGFFA